MAISVVKVEQKKGGGPKIHRLSDGRWILEDNGNKNSAHGRWSLWRPSETKPQHGHLVHKGASLGKLLKWAEENPPR